MTSDTEGQEAPKIDTRGMSRADANRAVGRDIDEANRHGFVRTRSLSGLHIGHGLWTGENWEDITAVSHTPSGTTVSTNVGEHPFGLDQQADVSKYRSTTTHWL